MKPEWIKIKVISLKQEKLFIPANFLTFERTKSAQGCKFNPKKTTG